MVDPLGPLHPVTPLNRRQSPPKRRDEQREEDGERREDHPRDSGYTEPDGKGGSGEKGGSLDEYAAPPGAQADSSVERIDRTWPLAPSGSLAAHCRTRGMAGSGRPMKNP